MTSFHQQIKRKQNKILKRTKWDKTWEKIKVLQFRWIHRIIDWSKDVLWNIWILPLQTMKVHPQFPECSITWKAHNFNKLAKNIKAFKCKLPHASHLPSIIRNVFYKLRIYRSSDCFIYITSKIRTYKSRSRRFRCRCINEGWQIKGILVIHIMCYQANHGPNNQSGKTSWSWLVIHIGYHFQCPRGGTGIGNHIWRDTNSHWFTRYGTCLYTSCGLGHMGWNQ